MRSIRYVIPPASLPVMERNRQDLASGSNVPFSRQGHSGHLANRAKIMKPTRLISSNASIVLRDTRGGKGAEVAYTGMTWSGFRPSDDACAYGYLIPSNMFAVVVLGYLAEICRDVLRDSELEAEAEKLADEIRHGIESYGVVDHPEYGNIYAYETDGKGNHLLMDDANVPSLLSIPYLGYTSADDPIYQNTRRFVLSHANPYYYQGTASAGVGSPHTPDRYIWPIALAIQGLTTTDREEKLRLLRLMAETDAGTGMMHEGFLVDDPTRYTRPWFSWANMMFCELMMDYCGLRVKANGIGGGRQDHHGNQ